MWVYILRRILYNIPVYLGILLLVMLALRTKDPVWAFLGKRKSVADHDALEHKLGLDRAFAVQYVLFVGDVVTLSFDQESWGQPGKTANELLGDAIVPSLVITAPALLLSSLISICVGLISSFYRGRTPDRVLVILAVLGMSISFLVYIILGQYFGAFILNDKVGHRIFAVEGYPDSLTPFTWWTYCMLPVAISVIVTMGYDTRFYRAVMVEEGTRDYITTARAKGASKSKIMFVHMLKNAMIPIITRVMITLPFLIGGSILLEMYFGIPGMGRRLILAIRDNDFPVIQAFTAVFAGLYIITNILTDVLYALVDPRVRLS